MTTRALLANTKLSQKVADFVKCKIRNEEYDTSNLNSLVQVISTNPFQISDIHHYIHVKDTTAFLLKAQEMDETFTLTNLQGGYFDLRKWNFTATMDPNSNKLQFDINVESVEYLGGLGSQDLPENPTPLFETAQVKSQLVRLKKFFIAQRFNQEHPFDPTPIDEARYAESERIRKQAVVPREQPEVSQLQDPFLIYNPPIHGKESVSHSQVDEYEELSINSQMQRKIGDHFRVGEQVKKPYSTMPADIFGLNLENLSNQPLIGEPIPEAAERDEGLATSGDKLPTFGGDQTQDQNKEPEQVTDKIDTEPTQQPKKRTIDDVMAEHSDSNIPFPAQTTKVVKSGWGPNHTEKQDEFKQFRDKKRLETKKSDPLDLLGMSESQEAVEYASFSYKPQEQKSTQNRPPETRFSKPIVEEDIEEEEINKEKPKLQQTNKMTSPVKQTMKVPTQNINSRDSKKSWSFGKSGGDTEEIEIIKHEKTIHMRQTTISDFSTKTQPYIKQQPVQQPVHHPVQQPVHHPVQQYKPQPQPDLVTSHYVNRQSLPYPPQQGSNKKPTYNEKTVQIQSKKPQHDVYEIDDTEYLYSFKPIKKPSPADKLHLIAAEKKFEPKPVRRQSGLSMDYLKSFTDLAMPKKSPSMKTLIENPIKAGSQIDISEFKPVSAKKPTNSSSTFIHRSPRVPSIQNSPMKFNETEFLVFKQMYDQEVGK